jgi:hypothetical protein
LENFVPEDFQKPKNPRQKQKHEKQRTIDVHKPTSAFNPEPFWIFVNRAEK